MSQAQLYIGLMSGTSADGIDLALVDFSTAKPVLVSSYYQAYGDELRQKITSLYQPQTNEIDRAFALDVELAKNFALAINAFLQQEQLNSDDIIAIASHGQTIRHRPNLEHAFTLQIGCCQTLATLTEIRVIGQFRHKDIALGGQGAPLVPAFHQSLFANSEQDVVIVNIGGIANITYLPKDAKQSILGFDTGPGNALLDEWFTEHNQGNFDENGAWGASGQVNTQLLTKLLSEPYFQLAAPKSTGREVFNLTWLSEQVSTGNTIAANDIQATLTALTAISISDAINTVTHKALVYLCGGGIHNQVLYQQLVNNLPNHQVALTQKQGIDADNLEAIAFAWLGFCYDQKISGNIPAVTGASRTAVLGTAFLP